MQFDDVGGHLQDGAQRRFAEGPPLLDERNRDYPKFT